MAHCMNMPVKKRLRFRDEDDLALLREVAGHNPFANSEVWETVKQNVYLLTGKDFSLKTIKDHLDLLIKMWLEKTRIMKDKSGIEEEYTEKDQLCQDIYDIMKLFRQENRKKLPKKKIENIGKRNREEWANQQWYNHIENKIEGEDLIMEVTLDSVNSETLDKVPVDHEYCIITSEENLRKTNNNVLREERSVCLSSVHNVDLAASSSSTEKKVESQEPSNQASSILRPVKSRKRRINSQREGLSYLERYDKNQNEIKKQEQALEARRIALEEKKLEIEEKKLRLSERRFELEEYERKKNLEIAEQQRNDVNKMIERQDKLIELLLLQISNSKNVN